jgi:hypothetical protein
MHEGDRSPGRSSRGPCTTSPENVGAAGLSVRGQAIVDTTPRLEGKAAADVIVLLLGGRAPLELGRAFVYFCTRC